MKLLQDTTFIHTFAMANFLKCFHITLKLKGNQKMVMLMRALGGVYERRVMSNVYERRVMSNVLQRRVVSSSSSSTIVTVNSQQQMQKQQPNNSNSSNNVNSSNEHSSSKVLKRKPSGRITVTSPADFDELIEEKYEEIQQKQKDRKKLIDDILSWKDSNLDAGYRGHFLSGDRNQDIQALVENFSAPALAKALRDREQTLLKAASALEFALKGSTIAKQNIRELDDLKRLLAPFSPSKVLSDSANDNNFPEDGIFSEEILEKLRQRLSRLPREIRKRAEKRACVVLALCFVDRKPSILFNIRAEGLRRNAGEVCLPGGLTSSSDSSIITTGLRELQEETGIQSKDCDVLGILRCDWSEVSSITGIDVTPIVCFIGHLENLDIQLNQGEVRSFFTVEIKDLADLKNWVIKKNTTPIFRKRGAPDDQVVWGLTAFVVEKFMRLLPSIVFKTGN